MQGKPSLLAWMPYSNSNDHTAERSREILPVIKETSCIAGIGAHDPDRNLGLFMEEMLLIGFSGVANEPIVGLYGPTFPEQLETAGIGFSREVELIRQARNLDVFTVAWAFDPREAQCMAEVGADVIGAIVGVTTGGLTGVKKAHILNEATEQVNLMIVAARQVNPDIMVLTHGGPFKDPETAAYSIQHSGANVDVAGSSGERLPTEQAVITLTEEYKR